ncbi:Rrf2 family transcriptional regulator, partial [Burkholderia sp. SIMBA_057]
VDSVRGPGGGYRLGCAANDISVGAVIHAVDEPHRYHPEPHQGLIPSVTPNRRHCDNTLSILPARPYSPIPKACC